MTVKNLQSIGMINHKFTNAPADVVSKRVNFQKIIVVLNGDKKSARVLPHALNFARENQAELLVIHTYPTQSREQVDLYLKGVKNKLKIEYHAVKAHVSDGIDEVTALEFALDSDKQTCVMVAMENRNWLHRLLYGTQFGALANIDNVHLYEVDVTR